MLWRMPASNLHPSLCVVTRRSEVLRCKVVKSAPGSRPLAAVLYLVRVIAVIATMRVLQYATDHTNWPAKKIHQ